MKTFPRIVYCEIVRDGKYWWVTSHLSASEAVGQDEPVKKLGVYKLIEEITVKREVAAVITDTKKVK